MSKNLSTAAITQFSQEIKKEYQGAGRLRGTTTFRNTDGQTYRFQRQGKGIAMQKASQAAVTPNDISYSVPTVVMENWYASEYTDVFDQAAVNFDEKAALAKTLAMAMSRREDQLIIDAAAAGTYSATPSGADQGLTIAEGGTNFTLAKLRSANERFQDLEIAGETRHIALTAAAITKLLSDTEVTSADYNTVRALVNGDLKTYMGFEFHIIGTQRDEGGLAKAGDIQDAYAWVPSALGYVSNMDIKSEVNYIADRTSWLCTSLLKSNAGIIENAGLIKIQYDVTA